MWVQMYAHSIVCGVCKANITKYLKLKATFVCRYVLRVVNVRKSCVTGLFLLCTDSG